MILYAAPKMRGFTLVEVLVALVILSVGLLGIAGLQLTGLRANQDAYLRSQANIIAQDVLERLRANPERALNGDFNVAFGESIPGDDLVGREYQDWSEWAGTALPDGALAVAVDAPYVTVSVRWVERRFAADDEPVEEPRAFRLSTRLWEE